MTMEYSTILYGVEADVAVIRLNRPAALNAMSVQMGEELLHALPRAARESRAVLITSEGRAFCSGADLNAGGMNDAGADRDVGVQLDVTFNPLMTLIRNSAVPVVTAVRGAAAGIGCSLALAGDIIVAGEGAYFLQAFAKIGLVPDGGSTYLLTRAVGRVRAMEMMLLGERLPAPKALDWGLINRLVPDEQIDAAAMAMAQALARGPAGLGLIRQLAWSASDASWAEALAGEREVQRRAGRTDDFLEGVKAFQEKRPAQFSGR